MGSSAVIICNPAAHRSSPKEVKVAAGLLQRRGIATEILLTGRRGDAERFASERAAGGVHIVIAAGGDGTINEVMNGLIGSDVPLGVLPLGTTNVLAKELDIPEEVSGAVDTIVSKKAQWISLGRITLAGGESRHFCLMAGIGFDGSAVYGMNQSLKNISGKLAYILSGVRSLVGYNPAELTLTLDGATYRGYTAVVGNAAKYGGHFKVTPDAHPAEPHLYVCIFSGKRRTDLLRYVWGVTRGSHLGYQDVAYLKADVVEVTGEAHVQIDGDYFGKTPAKITVAPDAVKVIY